jgi:hypothetical protein
MVAVRLSAWAFGPSLGAALLALAGCGGGGGANTPSSTDSGPVTASLSGTVRDMAGQPVAGVTVNLFHHNLNTTLSVTTDSSGRYVAQGLGTGNFSEYAVYASGAGLSLYPAATDAAGAFGKFDFNGLYRSVVHFAALPSRDVAGVDFVAARPGDRMAALPRTGQSQSYAAGDDAATGQGVPWPVVRFTDHGDGSVTDHLTGLVWLKNAGCFAPAHWAAALAAANQLASGACGLSDGSTAGQWRMPNANELESLVDVSQAQPAVPAASPFTNIDQVTAYWTSTTYMALTANALAIRFTDGRWINGADAGDGSFSNVKTVATNGLWAVRSGGPGAVKVLATGVYAGIGGGSFGPRDDASLQLGVPLNAQRFIDRGDGTLADTVTGLTWLKQADCIRQPWQGALDAVAALASGQCGLSDGSAAGQWRVPNRAEMLSLSDRAPTFPQASYLDGQYQGTAVVTGPVVFDRFIVGDYYWTSTTLAGAPAQAWTVYSCDFGVYDIGKTEPRYALAVR